MTSRNFVFTLNGIGEEVAMALMNAQIWDAEMSMRPEVRFYTMQLERGETGNLHLQGYAEFRSSVRGSKLRVGDLKPHYEKRRGTQLQAIEYAQKDDPTRVVVPGVKTSWTHGECSPGQGSRTDLEALGALVAEKGAAKAGLEMPGSYIRYHKGMHALEQLVNREVNKQPHPIKVVVLVGSTGTGKSHRAFHSFGGEDVWIGSPPTNGNWYAYDYAGEKNVILDDFRGNWMPCSALLRMLQTWPHKVNTCGSFAAWRAERVVITSNVHPSLWYSNVDAYTQEALKRRLDAVYTVTSQSQELDVWGDTGSEAETPPPVLGTSTNFQRTSEIGVDWLGNEFQ